MLEIFLPTRQSCNVNRQNTTKSKIDLARLFCSQVAMVITSRKQQIYSCFSLILGRDGRDAAEVGEKSLSS